MATSKELTEKLLKHYPFVYCPTLAAMTTNKNPKRGDIVLFYRNGTYAHTGIVYKYSGTTYYTIEGNTSGASGVIANGGGVCKKQYDVSSYPGTRFFRPNYSIVGDRDKVIDAIIAVAEAEVGYLEKASNSNLYNKTANAGSNNYTKYWDELYPKYQAQPWCAIFVTWCIMHGIINYGAKPSKSIDEIAAEVIAGTWGVGDERIKKLKSEGYDPNTVQKKVNDLLKENTKEDVTKVKEKEEMHPWIKTARLFNKYLLKDIENGKKWIYTNGSHWGTFRKSRLTGHRQCNCARAICWIFRKNKILKFGSSFYSTHGRIVWKGDAEKQIKKHCDVIEIGGKYTVDQLITKGMLKPGDVLCMYDMAHTFMVMRNGYYFDAGHAYCKEQGEGARYIKWIGKGTPHLYRPVGQIIRLKQ